MKRSVLWIAICAWLLSLTACGTTLNNQSSTSSFGSGSSSGGGVGSSRGASTAPVVATAFVPTASGFASVTVEKHGKSAKAAAKASKAVSAGTQSLPGIIQGFAMPASNLVYVFSKPQQPPYVVVNGYSFNASGGSIQQVSSTTQPAFADGIATYPADSTLYVGAMDQNADPEFYGYRVNAATGALTPIAGSPWVWTQGGGSVGLIAISPDGKSLCANIQLGEAGDSVVCFQRNADGTLNTASSVNPIYSYLGNEQIAFSTDSQWVFVPGATDGNIDYGSLTNSSQDNLSVSSGGAYPNGIAADPAGKWIAVANLNSSQVAMFSLGANGALSVGPTAATPGKPAQIAFSKNGDYLFATTSAGTAVYSVNQTSGALNAVKGSPVPGGTQGPIAAE